MTGVKPSLNLGPLPAAGIVVKKISHEGWLLHDLHRFIRAHQNNLRAVKNTPVSFGDEQSKPFADVVFDFRQAIDAYRLAEKVVRQGINHRGIWHGYFKTPRLAILPEPVRHDGTTLRADFKACSAHGEKGERIVCPQLQGVSESAFSDMRRQGAQIVSLMDCRISGIGEETFVLSIQTSGIVPYAVPLRRALI